MERKPPSDVVTLLQSRVLRVKIGLWLIPASYLGHEADEAVRLGVEAVDMRKYWLDNLPDGTRFIGVTPEKLLEKLDEIAERTGNSNCILVYNVDLLLAHLKQMGRKIVWEGLYANMPHRTHPLLIIVPETAIDLLPPTEELHHWSQENRLAGTCHAI